ncbi:MAG TPA: hypothetical protein ENK82_07320 [Campylobacterales bacterium]|nr:hypothetical protein [Campylobacterales bacterium]HHS93139.1 hypothetical protein [Campylobacterales bacterium]
MKNLKVVMMVLVLLSLPSMADFTVKDLFVAGGTKADKNDADQKEKSKNKKKERYDEDCI